MKILLGITSSIAAYRMPNLVSQLKKNGHEIRCILTEKAKAFVTAQSLAVMSGNTCYTNQDEWTSSERVLHIELSKWCDLCLIAPLSANTLAKLTHGICDNLVTSTVRALGSKPLLIAPAMNTRMWENPLTTVHLEQLAKFYSLDVIQPVEKMLADGDQGMGGLAEDQTIIDRISVYTT